MIHAAILEVADGMYHVDFEDLYGGGDNDFDDIQFIIRLETLDQDGDGIFDSADNCRDMPNANQTDADADGQGDACDADDDGDGAPDGADNCPLIANADQTDFDGDGAGDACDADPDGDGVNDGVDACLNTAAGGVTNANGCAIADLCPCSSTWKNHGIYVSCVAQAATTFTSQGLITHDERGDLVMTAAQSSCGR